MAGLYLVGCTIFGKVLELICQVNLCLKCHASLVSLIKCHESLVSLIHDKALFETITVKVFGNNIEAVTSALAGKLGAPKGAL